MSSLSEYNQAYYSDHLSHYSISTYSVLQWTDAKLVEFYNMGILIELKHSYNI